MSTSPEQLAALIKEKFPDYADVPDRELAARVVSQYPDYQSRLPAFNVEGAQKLSGASPQLVQHYLNLYDQFRQAGITPIVRSGMRTAEQENYLYTHGYPTKGNTGYGSNISPHQEGRAIDFSFAPDQRDRGRAILAQYARANGLHIPSDEPWHIAVPKKGETKPVSSGYERNPDPSVDWLNGSSVNAWIESRGDMEMFPNTGTELPSKIPPKTQQRQAQQTITPYDLEWHLGIPAAQGAGWFEGLPKRKQAEVYQSVAHAVAQDQIKKAQGVELTPSAKYQSDMRRHLQVAQPVYSTATARRVMGVPPEPVPLAMPQVGGVPSMSSIVTQARQQGDTRSPTQINDARLMEQATNNVSALSFSPTANIKGLYRAATKGIEGGFEADVQEEFQRLKEAQARENTPEMIAARKRIGSVPGEVLAPGQPSPRGVASAFQRFGGETLKAAGGVVDVQGLITSLGGVIPGIKDVTNQVRDYLNQRGNILVESASMPLNAQGEAITRSLPEKATDAVTSLGLSVAQLVLLKKATGLNLGPLMAIESTLKNSDRPISERIPDAAEAYVMGKVLDQHLTKPMSAIAFGAPTAVSTGLAYAQGNMSLEDALLQTGVQVGAGAILGGKPKGGEPGAVTLTKVPDFFPEEIAPGSAKTADWIYRQNEAFNNRIQAAEGRGDTAEADRLRAQLSGLQERFGKIMARTVPPEPGTGEASPELQQRVQTALENELRRTITRPTKPEIGEKQFAGLNNEQLQDLINARPKKGTTKAKRAEIADRKFAAEKELERRLAEPRTVPVEPTPVESQAESLRPSESDIPSFKDYVENRPQGGIPFDTLFPGTPEYNMLVREYVELYGQKGTQQDAGQRTPIQSQRGQAGEGNRQVGSEARNAAEASAIGGIRDGSKTQRQITELPNGQFQVTIETSTGKTKRTFNTREGAEAQLARLPRVPTEPSIGAQPSERTNPPLQASTEVPREPSATVTPQTLQSQGAQPVKTETTPSPLAVKEGAWQPHQDELTKLGVVRVVPQASGQLHEGRGVAGHAVEAGVAQVDGKAKTLFQVAVNDDPNIQAHELAHIVWRNRPDVQEFWRMKWPLMEDPRGRGGQARELVQEEAFADMLGWHAAGILKDKVPDVSPEIVKLLDQILDEHPILRKVANGEVLRPTDARNPDLPAAPSLPSSEAKPIEPAAVVKHSKPELDGAKVIGKTEGGAKLKVEKRDGTRTIIQNPRGPLGNREASVGRVVPVEPLKPIPILSGGGEATATTERGTTVNTRYAIVEAKDLVTSHDDFQNENGRFPAELQPRDRSRVASAAQISAIAKNPRPAELADSPKAAHGSPIIADDGVVEVGNGRSIALRQMYETGGEPASRYRQFVTENAERLGLDKSAVDKAEQPVLVRVRTTPLDDAQRTQFADEGNEQGGARMSAPEQALVDAKGISGPLLSLFRPTDSGEINTAANHSFIQAFMRDVVGPADIGEYVDSRGAISQAGIARIRNAIFAHAYADTPQGLTALEKLAESPDNNVRNITNGLLQRAGGFANLKEGIADGTRYDSLDITSDLTKALSKMSSLREQGQTVGDYLKQVELFDPELTPLQRQMLHILDEYKRSGKAINEVLGNYLELTEAAGNPNQEGLFGTRETAPDPDDLFEIAARKVAEDANATKGKPAQASLLTSQGVPPEPQTGSGRTGASPSAIGGTREPGDQGSGGLFEANQPDTSAGGAGTGALGFGRGRVKPPPPLPTTAPELQDVTRQMTPGLGNTHGEIVDGLLSLALPSAKSPEHLRIAETLGARIGEMHHRAEAAASALGKWITKFYKAGVDRGDVEPKDNPGVQFASALSTGGAIDPKFEAAARLVKTLFDGRLRLLEEAGVPLNQVRENYFPGMWTRESRVAFNAAIEDGIKEGVITEGENLNVSTPEQRQWVRERTDAYMKQGTGSDRDMLSYIARRPLAGKESFKKEKVFDDILTAQELGLRPFSNNPMEIAKLKLAEIDKSIAAHQFFGDLKGKGQIGQITPYEQVPAGWTKINDKYGTIYGSPTIKLTEHIDKAVYQGLLDVATKLGISHERVASLRGGNLGLSYQGENRIQTRFATETSVMAHEIGHQLDAKYDLWNNLLRTQPKSGDPGKGFRAGRSELRDIADLTERGKVSRSKEEKIAQVLEAYTHSPERMEEVAPRVYKWFDNFVKATPELAPLAEIKPGIALQKLTTEKYVGLPILGYRIVPQPVGDILNNYLSSSLYNSQYFGKLFKGWMATASVLNQSQLGVGSAFHASFTSGDVQTAAGANMIKDIYGVVRGNRDAGDIANSFGKWTTAIVRTPIVGDRVLNAWRDPNGVINPRIAQVVRATELAQGGFKLERGLKTEQTDKMVSDWYSGHQIKAAFRSPIAATELMAKPILEWLVPREKAGAFADMAWRIIEQNPGKSMEDMTPDFRKAWNRIDGRLGEVRYDRIFINNAAKNVVQGLIRAPGWTGGTLAELGGAFKDVGSFVSEWARTGKAPQEMPDRVAYGLSLLISTAVVNGMLTYAFTGEKPHGLDFWAFRDGGQDKDGNKTRLLIPTYMKDILAYYEEGPKALVAKGHPLISLVNDVVIKNQDYFGQEIRNPDDPYYQQAGEVGRYVLKAFIPFWIRGVQRQEEQGAGLGRQAASYFGVMPAPGYLIQDEPTKALNQMIKAKLPAVRTPPTDRQQAMREIIQGRRSGEDTAADLLAARQEGLVNKRDVQRIGEQGRISPMQAKLESVYRDYGLTGILDWYEKYGDYMDSEDKADTQKVIRKARLSLAQHPENLRGTASERAALIQRLNNALGLKSVPTAPPSGSTNITVPAPP